jgi:hypothetical protein
MIVRSDSDTPDESDKENVGGEETSVVQKKGFCQLHHTRLDLDFWKILLTLLRKLLPVAEAISSIRH